VGRRAEEVEGTSTIKVFTFKGGLSGSPGFLPGTVICALAYRRLELEPDWAVANRQALTDFDTIARLVAGRLDKVASAIGRPDARLEDCIVGNLI
jgi:hypothetical protein